MSGPESWQVQEAALFDLLVAATAVGQPLARIAGIDRVSPPTGDPPSPRIGFQYQNTIESGFGDHKRMQVNTFELTLVVVGAFDPTQADTARAAFDAVANLVNDGNGNGILPLLRSNSTLNGACSWLLPQNQQIEVGETGPDDPNLASIFRCTIVAQGEILI